MTIAESTCPLPEKDVAPVAELSLSSCRDVGGSTRRPLRTGAASRSRWGRRNARRVRSAATTLFFAAATALVVASPGPASMFPAVFAQHDAAANDSGGIFTEEESRELQKKKKMGGRKKKKKGQKKNGGGGDNANDDCSEVPEVAADNVFEEAGRRELQKNKRKKKKPKKKKGGGGVKTGCLATPLAVAFVVGLYNGGGLTADDILGGEVVPGEIVTYQDKIENALGMAWESRDSWFVSSTAAEDPTFPKLDLAAAPVIATGVDVECPPEVRAADPVSGTPTTCHEFTVSLGVLKPSAVEEAAVTAYVLEANDVGQRDGVLTLELDQLFLDQAQQVLFVTSAPPPPTPEPTSPPPTDIPTAVPTLAPVTASPTTASPTKAPSIYVTGTMDADVVLGLYNSKGYTAQQLVDGITPDESSFTYRGFLEASLSFVWAEKYPNSRRLLLDGGDGYGDGEEFYDLQEGEHPSHLERFDFLDAKTLREMATPIFHPDRRLGNLDLELVQANITSGIDVDCPEKVPPGTVSGAVNKCQNITVAFTVRSTAANVLRQDVRDDVEATFAEAQSDGTLTEKYNDIDARRIWRVQDAPRRAYAGGGGSTTGDGGGDTNGNFTGTPNAGTRSSGGDDDDGLPMEAIIGIAVGGVVLLCCCCGVGIFCYRRRQSGGGKVEGNGGEEPIGESKTDAGGEQEWNGDDAEGGYDDNNY